MLRNAERQEAVVNVLQRNGWAPCKGPSLAAKTFQTAVGPKTAYAYMPLPRNADAHQTLFAQYWSEGRDILEPHGALVLKDCALDELQAMALRFAATIDAVVSQSYAARLLRA